MREKKHDKLLGIRTVGIREWKDRKTHYNRYEATPYKALKKFFKNYKVNPTDQLVDYGCGRGRVAFYIHNRFHIPVTGIEVNDLTFDEALDNKDSYMQKANHIQAPIKFEYGLAENYKVDKADNLFYFFNPFSVQIFRKVVNNILQSVSEHERTVDLILFYPVSEYKVFLKNKTPFTIISKIKFPGAIDKKDKFIIYRLREDEI